MGDQRQVDDIPQIELRAEGSPAASARINVNIADTKLSLSVTVPAEPVSLRTVLPVLQGFTNVVVNIAESKLQAVGVSVSCKAGCGACCRQLVPISPSEAHAIHHLVETLPGSEQEKIRQRFAESVDRLDEAGILETLRNPRDELDESELAEQYFYLGISCPFLVEESCSIHANRPLACREYLVTSPPAECSRPGPGNVHCVKLPVKSSWALRAVDWTARPIKTGWLPLVLSLEWAAEHPESDPRPGPHWVQQFLTKAVCNRVE